MTRLASLAPQGRGKSGLDEQQLQAFDAAVALLEESGGLKVRTHWAINRPSDTHLISVSQERLDIVSTADAIQGRQCS
jgi:hypothetical protein